MAVVLKAFLITFMLIGLPMVLYGAWEIWGSYCFAKDSTGRVTAEFLGYHRVLTKTHNTTTGSGPSRSMYSYSVASYPEFSYRVEGGPPRRVREAKVHVFEVHKAGDPVEILLPKYGEPRIATRYSLYGRDLAILALGLGFILLPLFLYGMIVPRLAADAPAFPEFSQRLLEVAAEIKVGPISLLALLKFWVWFMAIGLVVGLLSAATPFVRQMRFGSGGRLIQSLEQERFDDARQRIIKGSGINATNEYDQTPLILALEADQSELARMLVEAGADVNSKSKMLMTPLRIATQDGDLEMVKLLLEHGASPNTPEDEYPPVTYAIRDRNQEIALALVAGGMDLKRRYGAGTRSLTLGDMALRAEMPELVELIRERGGPFTETR